MKDRIDILIKNAMLKHGSDIKPCPQFDSFYESITIFDDSIILWYNDSDDSTHIIMESK